jgi:hypothetical protein
MSALGHRKLLQNFAASENAKLIGPHAVPAQGGKILAIPVLANRRPGVVTAYHLPVLFH